MLMEAHHILDTSDVPDTSDILDTSEVLDTGDVMPVETSDVSTTTSLNTSLNGSGEVSLGMSVKHSIHLIKVLFLGRPSISVSNSNPDVEACKAFVTKTCGCTVAKGSPCSSLFPLDYYISHRLQATELTHNELDLVIMGSLMSVVNMGGNIKDGKHKPVKRKRTFCNFQHNGHQVCQVTYRFLLGIRKHRLKAIKAHFLSNGLSLRIHGNTGKLPHNVTSYASTRYIVQFIANFAEQHAILLPGCIPGYKRDDFKLLPSSITKKVYCVICLHSLL